LKDIFALLSRVGLGITQHHVISQGEVDRILWASLTERQEMVEDSLGLREYHLKWRDAERKLGEVDVNMRQVDAQRRELLPHVKYLKAQAPEGLNEGRGEGSALPVSQRGHRQAHLPMRAQHAGPLHRERPCIKIRR